MFVVFIFGTFSQLHIEAKGVGLVMTNLYHTVEHGRF